MKKSALVFILLLVACGQKFNREDEEKAIRNLLKIQETAWNNGNIDEFMKGYWKSDSLMFVGKNVTKGWNATIERYRKSYPDKEAMGRLEFAYYGFKFVDNTSCLVTGKYHLIRTNDDPGGMFTLLFKKIDGEWIIVYDHTSDLKFEIRNSKFEI